MNDSSQKPKTAPRDVFLHLLFIAALYASTVSFITLLWQYVNRFLPDPLAYGSIHNIIRTALSVLVIVFPVFLWLGRHLEKDMAATPEKRTMGIRKWLLHLTLFVAAITIIVDLVVLVYNYLGGELSPRFFLKIASILAVAAAVFTYFIWEIRRASSDMPKKMTRLAYAVIAIVCAGIVGGFFIAGSPRTERLRRFDEQRVNDLISIQHQVIDYWQRKERLPVSLEDLASDITGWRAPTDPETQAVSYRYRKTGDLSFELCAVFSLDSKALRRGEAVRYSVPAYGPSGLAAEAQNWEHGIGEKCFTRAIDPDFYKPKAEKPLPLR